MTNYFKRTVPSRSTMWVSLILMASLQACDPETVSPDDVPPEFANLIPTPTPSSMPSPSPISAPVPTPTPTPSPTPAPSPTPSASVVQRDANYPKVREEIFTVDFENLPDNWVGEAIDEERARSIFLDPYNLHEYSLAQNGPTNRGFGGKCPNGKDVVFLDENPEQGRMMCVRHCAEERIEANFLHMHWADDGQPTSDKVVAEWDFIVPECMGDNRNCTSEWGGKMAGLGHGFQGGGKGDECGINSRGWRKGYPGGSESSFHGMSYRVMWNNPGLIDSNFRPDDYVGRNEACEVRNGHDAGDKFNLQMYIYYWKAKWQQWGGRQGSEVSMCNLPDAGDWTKMTISVDPNENLFEAWVDGQYAAAHTAPQTLSCGGTTKDPVEGVSGFFMGNFFGGAVPTGQWATPEQVMCFDNIHVYKAEE